MRFLDCVVPLFGVGKKSEPRLVGSGFLIGHEEHRLLVSAAHVADETSETPLMLAGAKNVLKEIPGQAIKTRAPNGDRNQDNIDVAFWLLPKEFAEETTHSRLFLPTALLQPHAPSLPPQQYSFVGYPYTGSKRIHGTTRMRAQPESFNAKCVSVEEYAAIGASPEGHIAIEFDHKVAQLGTTVIVPKDRKGMSGGPVFGLTDGGGLEGIPRVRIVGIAIEHHKPQRLLLATKIESLLQLIADHFGTPQILVSNATFR